MGSNPSRSIEEYQALCDRHGKLVLKLFEGGLSEVEARDLVQVRELLDEIDMKRMAPVFVELEERLARLRAFGLEVDEMRRILEQKNRFRHVTKRR